MCTSLAYHGNHLQLSSEVQGAVSAYHSAVIVLLQYISKAETFMYGRGGGDGNSS